MQDRVKKLGACIQRNNKLCEDVFDEFIKKVNLAVKVTRNAFKNESKVTEELLNEPVNPLIKNPTTSL